MIRKGILLLIYIIEMSIDVVISLVIWLKKYTLLIWRKNAFRKWAIHVIDMFNAIVQWLESYLEGIRRTVQYRMYFQNTAKFLKGRYRELRMK